jgi:type IV secretory pathway VirB2 component (pilin)
MLMTGWMVAFFVIAAIAIVLQMLILAGMYFQFKRTSLEMSRAIGEVQRKLDPILFRINRVLENSEDKISSIVTDAAEMTRLARGQAQKIDRVVSDALDRTRSQIIRADSILTGTLEAVEDAGVRVRRSVLGPLQQASAVLKGIRTGIDFIRGQRGSRESSIDQDDELFI